MESALEQRGPQGLKTLKAWAAVWIQRAPKVAKEHSKSMILKPQRANYWRVSLKGRVWLSRYGGGPETLSSFQEKQTLASEITLG